MRTTFWLTATLAVWAAPAYAGHHARHPAVDHQSKESAAHPDAYDALIAEQARLHGVPEALVHRVVMRESRYNAGAMHKHYLGLMQITYATACSMGYKGSPTGLLDAKTNLTYAVPYLANAYLVADKNPDRAVVLYSSGYYYEAKRKHQLAMLRTAISEPIVAPITVVAEATAVAVNPVSQLFHALVGQTNPQQAQAFEPQATTQPAQGQQPQVQSGQVQEASAAQTQTTEQPAVDAQHAQEQTAATAEPAQDAHKKKPKSSKLQLAQALPRQMQKQQSELKLAKSQPVPLVRTQVARAQIARVQAPQSAEKSASPAQ